MSSASVSAEQKQPFDQAYLLKNLQGKDDKVCVVSILGKSHQSLSKASVFNPIIDSDIFQGYAGQDLECYYDCENHVVYLHHWSLFDAGKLISFCNNILSKDGSESMEEEISEHAKTLLFLFSVSHLVLVNQPGSSFDVSYIHLFNTINAIRLKFLPFVSEILSEFPLPKEWVLSGRPCSPRMLFIFSKCLLDADTRNQDGQRGASSRRLQHAVEDQIYRLLRKSRTITNTSNNSLFAVPANQEFVFFHTRSGALNDPMTNFLNQLRWNCTVKQETDSRNSPSFGMNPVGSYSMGDNSSFQSKDTSFREFIEQHTHQALTKGFDDNVGRHPIPALFELCSCEVWFSMATALHQAMFSEDLDPRLRSCFNTLNSLLNTERRFSDNRCSKVLPLAESTYQDGLPSHYTQSYHQSKLSQAKLVFRQHARGPCLERYLHDLEDSCDRWWRNGHQLCEAVSLTGNHCVNQLHSVAGEESELEEMSHCSQYKTRAACDCGEKQADRNDPFNHKAGNYEFYQDLSEECCQSLDHIELPVFKASSSEIRAGQAEGDTSTAGPHTEVKVDTPTLEPRCSPGKADVSSGLTNLSLALSLDQSGAGAETTCSHSGDGESGAITLNIQQTGEPVKTLCRQPSTVEYLPGMINTNSPSGLLPLFPSWSICCLTASTGYSSSQGIQQPGFLPGSNFLLPWDIPVTMEKEKWPTVGEGLMRKGKQRQRSVKEVGEVTVRAYLGVEYECPRGHRFFCSGPEKIIKVSSTSTVKDNANKLLTLDMPLYCQCNCRSTKGLMSQLMRVFVVTPDSPVTITINPRVRPAPPPCPLFHPGTGPLELTPGHIWVVRLPFVYMGTNGVLNMPTDPDQLGQCRLLQGMFEYTEQSQPGDT